ncbi:hypothetical protein L208DRAFT_1420098 [Tricholoma matsutake]|nr:hypothetical protein L208DRAFT_1420098 [Tricholoma matsutake 945]
MYHIMHPIFKVPCILIATVGIHASITSPTKSTVHETAVRERQHSPRGWGRYLQYAMPHIGKLKALHWAVGLAEIAAIVGSEFSASFAKRIASTLMNNKSSDDLRLTPLSIIGMISICCGTSIRVWCYRTLKNLFTFDITIRENHRLVTTGPYGIVRHPSYTGTLMMNIGIAFWYGTHGSWLRVSGILSTIPGAAFFGGLALWLVLVMLALFERGPVEDAALKKKFGKEWEEYARKVPYLFIPGLW